MGILRTAALTGLLGIGGGVATVGAGVAYLLAQTSLVPLTKDDQVFKTKIWARYNPKKNPALKDDVIAVVPLSKIRPELRDDEAALTLEFCRGAWSRWGMFSNLTHLSIRLVCAVSVPPPRDDLILPSTTG